MYVNDSMIYYYFYMYFLNYAYIVPDISAASPNE